MWKPWRPRPVKIVIDAWMEKGADRMTNWHAIAPNECLQGLLACHGEEQRVYVVTIEPERDYDRVPRVITIDTVDT